MAAAPPADEDEPVVEIVIRPAWSFNHDGPKPVGTIQTARGPERFDSCEDFILVDHPLMADVRRWIALARAELNA